MHFTEATEKETKADFPHFPAGAWEPLHVGFWGWYLLTETSTFNTERLRNTPQTLLFDGPWLCSQHLHPPVTPVLREFVLGLDKFWSRWTP